MCLENQILHQLPGRVSIRIFDFWFFLFLPMLLAQGVHVKMSASNHSDTNHLMIMWKRREVEMRRLIRGLPVIRIHYFKAFINSIFGGCRTACCHRYWRCLFFGICHELGLVVLLNVGVFMMLHTLTSLSAARPSKAELSLMDPSRSETINVAAIECGLWLNVYLLLFSISWASELCQMSLRELDLMAFIDSGKSRTKANVFPRSHFNVDFCTCAHRPVSLGFFCSLRNCGVSYLMID